MYLTPRHTHYQYLHRITHSPTSEGPCEIFIVNEYLFVDGLKSLSLNHFNRTFDAYPCLPRTTTATRTSGPNNKPYFPSIQGMFRQFWYLLKLFWHNLWLQILCSNPYVIGHYPSFKRSCNQMIFVRLGDTRHCPWSFVKVRAILRELHIVGYILTARLA